MKHARCWLLLVVAFWLLPTVAFAQPGKKPPTKPPAPPTAPAPGGDIEIDDPNAPKQPETPPPGGDTPPPGGDSGGGGICEIDPTACPKTGDIKKLADRPV